MKRLFYTLLFLLQSYGFYSYGQNDSYCLPLLKQAERFYKSNKLELALKKLQEVEMCDYQDKLIKKRDSLQRKIFSNIIAQRDSIQRVVKIADSLKNIAILGQQQIKKEALISENISNSLKFNALDATLALRLAEVNYQNNPQNAGAISALRITSDPANNFYSSLLQSNCSGIYCLAYSPNGKLLAAGDSRLRVLEVWSIDQKKVLFQSPSESNWIHAVAFSPDNQKLVYTSRQGVINLLNLNTWQIVQQISNPNIMRFVSFSPDGTQFMTAYGDGKIITWDAFTAAKLDSFNMPNPSQERITTVAISRTWSKLAIGFYSGEILVVDVLKKTTITNILAGHKRYPQVMVFSPNEKKLASGAWDNTVRLWDLTTSKESLCVPFKHADVVETVDFSPDGNKLASGGRDKFVKIWDVNSGIELYSIKAHVDKIAVVVFSPDGTKLASSSWGKGIKVWDIVENEAVYSKIKKEEGISEIAFTTDWKQLVLGYSHGVIQLNDVEHDTLIDGIQNINNSRVESIAISSDKKMIALGDASGELKIWSPDAPYALTDKLPKQNESITHLDISSNGKWLTSSSYYSKIKVWDCQSWQEWYSIDAGSVEVPFSVFSPNSDILAVAGADIKFWSIGQKKLIDSINVRARYISFSKTGGILGLITPNADIQVWDWRNKRKIFDHSMPDQVNLPAVFSPDDNKIAICCNYNTIKIFDIQSGLELFELPKQKSSIKMLAFSPDGTRLALALDNGSFLVYQIQPYLGNVAATFSLEQLINAGYKPPLPEGKDQK